MIQNVEDPANAMEKESLNKMEAMIESLGW